MAKSTPIKASDVERIYRAYGYCKAYRRALKAITAAITRMEPEWGIKTVPLLLEKTQAFAAARERGDESKLQNPKDFWPDCPHPATWFNGDCFRENPYTWEPKTRLVNHKARRAQIDDEERVRLQRQKAEERERKRSLANLFAFADKVPDDTFDLLRSKIIAGTTSGTWHSAYSSEPRRRNSVLCSEIRERLS